MAGIKTLMATAAIGALGACATGGGDEAAPDRAPDFALDYEAYTLPNGLDVVLARDASDPIVAVTTVVHAGSNRERPGRTGFAHFFEHMAFNDSENVPQGANRRDIPAWGGQRNGGTWSDGTIYYEVVPKDAFEKILWIDSDRLGYMIRTVTPEALEREKQVVKNEKRQRVDNAPYGHTGEVIRRALYPQGHPYSWTVIGELEDLQAATLADVREFYDAYYGPNNATLAIVGDIDIEETKERVAYWFGEIERGPEVGKPEARPVTLDETIRLSFEDNFARLPRLTRTYPTPQAGHQDEIALDVLAALLAGSKGSPLYVEVVRDRGLAPNAYAYHNAMEVAGELTVVVTAEAGQALDEVEAALDAGLAAFAANGVNADDLARIKAEQETSLYGSVATALGLSRNLATGNEFAGDPGDLVRRAEAIRTVTAEDVMRAFETHVANRPYVLTSFVPKGQGDLAVTGSTPASVSIEVVRDDVAAETVSQGKAAAFERTPTVADRSEPAFGDLPLSTTPDTYEASLPNGVALTGIEANEVPLVSFRLVFGLGTLGEADESLGATSLLTDLFAEGSATRTPEEMERALGLLGARVFYGAGQERVTVSGTTLARNLEETVALVTEVLTAPRFEASEFGRVRDAALTTIEARRANPSVVASLAYEASLYGAHPAARPVVGTPDTVAALSLDDLRARHAAMTAAGLRVHVAGDVTPEAARTAFAPLAAAIGGDAEPVLPPADPAPRPRVVFIDVPGSKQSVIRAGRLTVPADDPAHERLVFANEKLGGGIGGDLAQTLRIEKGYTYGAYSSVGRGRIARPFTIRTSVRANATEASLDLLAEMLRAYPETFGEPEAALTRNKIIKDAARAQESLTAKLGILDRKATYGLEDDLVEARQRRLLATPPNAMAEAAAAIMNPAEMVWVVVGDGATQEGAVRGFAERLGVPYERRGAQ